MLYLVDLNICAFIVIMYIEYPSRTALVAARRVRASGQPACCYNECL